MGSKQGKKDGAEEITGETYFEPKFEWEDNGTKYVLRVTLPGFKKEDFRVQVDGAGKLTIRGQRPAGTDGGYIQLNKIFQLPATANLDEIAGRLEGNVLSLTMGKLPVAPPQAKAAIKEEHDAKLKEEVKKAEETKEEDEAKTSKQEKPTEKKEEAKPKAATKPSDKVKEEEDAVKPKDEGKVDDGEKKGLKADGESLDDKVKRMIDEARERVRKAKAEEEKEEEGGEREKSSWKQCVLEETINWSDGLVEMISKNKEVITTAIAAFTLGVFVSHKLFSRK